jgi:hypothetical protein
MPNSEENVSEKYWLNNKQVVGAFGFFIILGIGYGEFKQMQANDTIHALELKALKERATEEEKDMKGLIYRLNNDTKEYLNKRINNKVDPLEGEVVDLIKWKSYQRGLEDALN